jgi:hypothetical protein
MAIENAPESKCDVLVCQRQIPDEWLTSHKSHRRSWSSWVNMPIIKIEAIVTDDVTD